MGGPEGAAVEELTTGRPVGPWSVHGSLHIEADLTQEWDEGGAFKAEGRCLGPLRWAPDFF